MTNTFSTDRQHPSSRAVLIFVGVGLIAIFASSFVYRMENPSIRMQAQPQSRGQNDMSSMGEFMTRLEQNPNDVEALSRLGRIFMEMGAWERASVFWKRLLDVEENLMGRYFYGISLFQMKEYQEAAAQFERVLEQEPNQPLAHFNLGVLYKHYLNRPTEGDEHFKKVLELAPPEQTELREQVRQELERQHGQADKN
ncbi:MAG: tetratricopeptide repeat protein [Desulfovibrionales bacterium]